MPSNATNTNQLRALREARGFTQVQLAKKARMRQATISDWENGKSHMCDFAALGRLCTALACGADDLLQRKAGRKSEHERKVRALVATLDMDAQPSVETDFDFELTKKQRSALASVLSCDVPAAQHMRAAVKAADRNEALLQAYDAGFEKGRGFGKLVWLGYLNARQKDSKRTPHPETPNEKVRAAFLEVLADRAAFKDKLSPRSFARAVSQKLRRELGYTSKLLRKLDLHP